jgi:hypothetical protein
MKNALEEIQGWFNNLFEGKAIYHEKVITLVRLEHVEITSSGFGATAIPLLAIGGYRGNGCCINGRSATTADCARKRVRKPLIHPIAFL